MLTDHQALVIAGTMRALAVSFEGNAHNASPILYQAVVGWDADGVGERCKLIDSENCDGVFALFDPATIEKGPVWIGVCIRDGEQVRLELGTLWMRSERDPAVLVTANGRSHLIVEGGRFVERVGPPTRDIARGKARARRRVAELAVESMATSSFLITA